MGDRNGIPLFVAFVAAAWYIYISSTLVLTEPGSKGHDLLHGVMSATFSIGFLYLLVIVGTAAGEVRSVNVMSGPIAEAVASVSLISFLFAVVAWIIDNFACGFL